MTGALDAKIAERRARLVELDREKVVAEAELRAYEDARSMISGTPLPSTGGMARKAVIGVAKRVRKSSATWERIVAECAPKPDVIFSIDDVLEAATRRSFSPTRGNVRSQMAAYVGRGLLARAGTGTFRTTSEGASVFGSPRAEVILQRAENDHALQGSAPNRVLPDQVIPGRPPDFWEKETGE